MSKLEMKRLKDIQQRKLEKEKMKANETPEEKRSRRLLEKQAKDLKRRERMGWDTEYQHYTNQDNPFGDAHLTSTFVWGKKLEKSGLKSAPHETLELINRQKQMENKIELEKVKKRRQERESERVKREEEMNLMQRSREAAQFEEWKRQEDQFHLQQAKLRSKIRINDGRAKPIDLLAQYISEKNLDDSIEMQMHEPYTYLNGLDIQDLEDLLADISVYIELEKDKHVDYWNDLTVIVQDELQKLRKSALNAVEEDRSEYQVAVRRREGIHQTVAKDVTEIFRGKTTQQLEELKKKIEDKLSNHTDGVDIGYWESLLSQLKAHMARSRLRDRHQEILKQKLEMLKQEQNRVITAGPSTSGPSTIESNEKQLEEERKIEDDLNKISSMIRSDSESDTEEPESVATKEDTELEDVEKNANNLLVASFHLYDEGNYSPKYIRNEDDPAIGEYLVITQEMDEERIDQMRGEVLERDEDIESYSKEEMRMRKEASKDMDNDEAVFSVETKLDSQIYLWSDKYRPRKPRYFNRVHTGFEWNKYNQTHYDMDNPPPKIVQGYKFNIFYPDLIDKGSTPQYFLTVCTDNKDFAILKFHAGPPYEDIAFKIVNREWEFSYKRGFRCQFHNNIFQLWFHFKRYRYRR